VLAAPASAGSLRAIAVRQTGANAFNYAPLRGEGARLALRLDRVAPEEKVYLVVAATPDRVGDRRTFSYAYAVSSLVP
jgi:hypothetical protein